MPIYGIETAYKDRYSFAPLSQRAIQWYTLPLRFIPANDAQDQAVVRSAVTMATLKPFMEYKESCLPWLGRRQEG
jgi:hypothetical protein